MPAQSALTGFEAAIGLVDNIGAPTAANHAIIAVAALQRFKAVDDLHDKSLEKKKRAGTGRRAEI